MKKKIGLISIISVIGIGIGILSFMMLSNEITAEIPSATSYASKDKEWSIHFSETMDPDSFTEETITVTTENGEKVAIQLEWDDSYSVVTIHTPNDGYTVNTQYYINVSNQVETANGKKLSKSLAHSFQVVEEPPKVENQEQLVTLLKERMPQPENNNRISFGSDDAQEESADTESFALNDASGDAGSSDTNVQVQGVDEGDTIKTDGEYIFFVRDYDIVIASGDGEQSSVVSLIEEEQFYPNDIYLQDDLLITIGYTSEPIRTMDSDELDNPLHADMAIYPIYHGQTTVFIYDISDQENPEQLREFSIEGSYHTSRIVDDHLYLVANERPPYQILEDEDIEVRPFIKDSATDNEAEPIDFESMYFFPESMDESYLLLSSIDLRNMDKEAHVETYLGASNELYMSENHMYIAVQQYEEVATERSDDRAEIMIFHPPTHTEINQFIIDDGKLTFNASTQVEGTLINQFAMDERGDTFRVATTKGDIWNNDDDPSTNNLYTFDINLNPLGSVEGLAEGEQIYSVRFMDTIAYMVTFEQIDPFFVIDLEDPSNPTVLGELKIPGFSNYLHPLDDDHVIGFGQNTKLEENEHGSDPIVRMDGIKISIFDVSDLTNPIEKFSEVIGQGSSYTELNYNHKALYKHPSKNVFGFPATLFESSMVQKNDITYEEQKLIFEGALLYEISSEDGIALEDTITHQKEFKDYPEWESEIKRMVSIDNILYTFSNNQMIAYDMERKSTLQTVQLPEINMER